MSIITQKLKTYYNHQGFKRYAKNTAWMFSETILRLIAGFVVGLWVARYLGPEKFGTFSYALAFAAIFGGLAKLGLDGIIIRELVNFPEKRDIYLGTAFWLKFFGGIITLFIIAIATLFTSNDSTTNLYIFIIAAGIIFQSFEVVDFYFQSKVLSKFVSICKMTQLFLSSLLKIYFVIKQADLFWFVLVILFDSITLSISLVSAYKYQKLGTFFNHFDWKIGRRLLSDSWALILSNIAIMLYMRIDQIMIKEMLDERSVGLYSAAVRISEIWYFVPIIITNSLFTAILNAKKISEEFFNRRLQRLYTLMVWIAMCIALPITFLSNWIVTTLYGAAYLEASKVLMIHIWTAVFVFLGFAFSQYLLTENMTKISFYRTISGAIINIILNLLWLPKYGIIGSAMATLIAQFSTNYLYDIFDKRLHKQLKLKTLAIIWPFGIYNSSRVDIY
jgi:O-antigen/teichoic acid export membrane protein